MDSTDRLLVSVGIFQTPYNDVATICHQSLCVVQQSIMEAEWRIYDASLNYTIMGSDNGSSPGRRQAIIWTNAGISIGPLGTNFSEIIIEIKIFSFTN